MKKKITKIFPKIKLIKGLDINTLNVGIKNKTKDDVAIISFRELANVAIVLTKSKTYAPNIKWLKKIKNNGEAKVLFINSGNANAYTGKKGYENVLKIVDKLAKTFECNKENILISSTGVIGEQLPIKKIIKAIPRLSSKKNKKSKDWLSFAKAITTTDTFPKGAFKETNIGNNKFGIVGICKGSGMIAPNMATMLAFLFTDANLPSDVLKKMLSSALDKSFNNITVDGDTSTNDMVCIFSLKSETFNKSKKVFTLKELKSFQKDLDVICIELAKKIVLDGEGAKKLIEIQVSGAKSNKQAKNVAFSIANSLLVKTAIAGEDANWGRIIMAIGKSSATIIQDKVSIKIGKYFVIKRGEISKSYNEKLVTSYLKKDEIKVDVNLLLGNGVSKVWTCDLTKKYIEINADYRS
ncbi:bifunctional glutamate N-acetyltransferase/amino-acid acetyltransferase ArgJ [Alphaproteobacteria bacterium]|nr:bifunctional glutamate N-acetyltransferase/amino-acid acetyltransferase ArgJ [Alphaproteobacteria bacterium]